MPNRCHHEKAFNLSENEKNHCLNGIYIALWVLISDEKLKRTPRCRAPSCEQIGTGKAPFTVVQWKDELKTTKPAEFTGIHTPGLWLCHCIWIISYTSFVLFLWLCKTNQVLTTTTVLSDGEAEINSPHKTVSYYQDYSALIWSHTGKNKIINNHILFLKRAFSLLPIIFNPRLLRFPRRLNEDSQGCSRKKLFCLNHKLL